MSIETERLLLRPFEEEEDARDLYGYLHEPDVNCFMDMKVESLEDALEAMRKRMESPEYHLAIELKDAGRVIGDIFAFPEAGGPHPGDADIDTFSPCWMLGREHRGRGYAFEAAAAFFDHLFEEKGARRLYAYVEDYNAASQRLCERLGMRREGLFLEFVAFVDNPYGTRRYENTYQYAILKREWTDRKRDCM